MPCQDDFKTSSRCLQDILQKRLQDIFKTSSRHLQNLCKISSRHLQDLFKTYHPVKLFLLTRFQNYFETYSKNFLRCTATTFTYRKIFMGHISEKLMVNVQNLRESRKFLILLHFSVAACRFILETD